MSDVDHNLDGVLDGLDEAKRIRLRRLVLKSAFVTPVVASFAMAGLTVERAAAQSNAANSGVIHLSDRRLKADVVRVGTHPAGFGLYRFRYLWSKDEYVGVMAQEVGDVMPDAVVRGDDGFLRVDYDKIGMEMQPLAAWQAAGALPQATPA
jgi:hypothetical protein